MLRLFPSQLSALLAVYEHLMSLIYLDVFQDLCYLQYYLMYKYMIQHHSLEQFVLLNIRHVLSNDLIIHQLAPRVDHVGNTIYRTDV